VTGLRMPQDSGSDLRFRNARTRRGRGCIGLFSMGKSVRSIISSSTSDLGVLKFGAALGVHKSIISDVSDLAGVCPRSKTIRDDGIRGSSAKGDCSLAESFWKTQDWDVRS
jgi:hypothetical protein